MQVVLLGDSFWLRKSGEQPAKMMRSRLVGLGKSFMASPLIYRGASHAVRHTHLLKCTVGPSYPLTSIIFQSKYSTKTAPPPPPPSRRSGEGEHKKESFMAAKLRSKSTKRKPPPVSVSTNGLDMSTGLSSPTANSESGMLHAAQLAVSHSAQSPTTDNRRSSFSKENGSKSYIRIKPPQGQKPAGQLASKMLARSTRKK